MIEAARDLLASAERIVVLTGAGVSAESGVPTFRGAQGLWKSFRPEQLATPEAFASDPRLVWEWYDWRRGLVGACEPNPAHRAIAALAAATPQRVDVITQNVDGLHTVAAQDAAASENAGPALPLELHGSLFRVRCASRACGYSAHHREEIDTSSRESLPRCPSCGALLRPAVVWFGEALDEDVIARAFESANAAEVCLVVGTSAVVHPAASIPIVTVRAGGHVVEVNPDATPLTPDAHLSIRGSAGTVLPEMLCLTENP